MKDQQILGIGFPRDKKFYYLDTGQHVQSAATIDRLRTILTARDVLRMNDHSPGKHRIMSLADAKLESMEVQVIYINSHIKTQRELELGKAQAGESLWD